MVGCSSAGSRLREPREVMVVLPACCWVVPPRWYLTVVWVFLWAVFSERGESALADAAVLLCGACLAHHHTMMIEREAGVFVRQGWVGYVLVTLAGQKTLQKLRHSQTGVSASR